MKKYILTLLIISAFTFSSPPYSYSLHYCPDTSCESLFLNSISSANESLLCAFYDIGEKYYDFIISRNLSLNILIESDNWFTAYNHAVDKNPYLMHNKFCIIDNKTVITGSFNPTDNGLNYNNNSFVQINSTTVASTFYKEFLELKNRSLKSNNKLSLDRLDILFCPEDNCEQRVIQELQKAKSEIEFKTFSFTSSAIATELIYAKERGILVSGVIENRMATNSVYSLLKFQGINVSKDTNPKTMHHKLFIIDNKTILTGSYNPTNNGNLRNDETLLILTS